MIIIYVQDNRMDTEESTSVTMVTQPTHTPQRPRTPNLPPTMLPLTVPPKQSTPSRARYQLEIPKLTMPSRVYPLSGPPYRNPPEHFNHQCSKYLLIDLAQTSRSPPWPLAHLLDRPYLYYTRQYNRGQGCYRSLHPLPGQHLK